MDLDEHEEYLRLTALKAKRARRRELEARMEVGHLKAWFHAQDWPEPTSLDMFRRLMRAYRHSCHAPCCAAQHWERRHATKSERRRARMALRKRIQPYFDRTQPLS